MIKKLTDVCDIQYGYAFNSAGFTSDAAYIPLIRIRDVKRGYSETYFSMDYPKEYIVHNSDLLISMDGEFNIARWKGQDALLNQRVCKVTAKQDVNEEYLRFALTRILKRLEDKTSFVTVKHLSARELNKLELVIPAIEEQNRTALLLSTLEALQSLKHEELSKLDELVNARFVEMFGDPVYNPKGWPMSRLEDVCTSIVDCPHSTPHYTDVNTGYICIRTSVVKKNKILWDKVEYIPEEEYEYRIQRKRPSLNDVVYTREGAILGIAAVIDRGCNIALGQRMMLLTPNINKCNPIFLSTVMNIESFFYKAIQGVSGSASPHINVGDIKNFSIIIPPIQQQNQFIDFVNQIDKSKSAIQKSLDETQTLFNSLMQEYFG